jgi:riboflavin synthase
MFTGLIEVVGSLSDIRNRGNYQVLRVSTAETFGPLTLGESVSCDGACLTVIESGTGWFLIEASQETAARTILSNYRIGSAVNLERSLSVGSRLGGHFVSGHVDTVGTVTDSRKIGESLALSVRFDRAYDRLVVEKGSIAINGVSLTINRCDDDILSVNIIPFTLQATNLEKVTAGTAVNIEFDLLGKYVLKAAGIPTVGGLTVEKLLSSGW